ncbi:MAG TPA: GDSL-type esterase/lipase family protein [Polyangia bacterium]|nr:GDSL-type esterase/lipase family protein [Polyangia bacterium]
MQPATWQIDREAYAEQLRQLAAEPKRKGGVVFVGDSLTAWSRFDTRIPGAVLRGIAGDQADLVRDRLAEVVARTPAQLFLMIGLNDLQRAHPPAQVADDIAACVDFVRAHSPATRLIVQSVLPSTSAELQALIVQLNVRLRALANDRAQTWLDVHAQFLAPNGRVRPGLIQPDHVHLTEAGYDAWLTALEPLLP